ncbi:MAG: hypothetical protein J6W52_04330 [Bacteroidaceae bacterium]|nr:hypothetical protein [Bacteroidaceae bacterium]
MEENNILTAERSLEIIRESIERSQRTITRNSALPQIWWGVCVVVFSFIIAYLWANHGGPSWNALWAVMWLVGYVGNRMIDKKKETVPTTFVGKTIGYVWATFGMFCGGLGLMFCLIGKGILPLELIMPKVYVFGCITSIISLCFGMGTAITGLIIRNRIIQICGFIAGLGGFFGALHFPGHEQLYVMAVVAVIGLIVPGVLIELQNQKVRRA